MKNRFATFFSKKKELVVDIFRKVNWLYFIILFLVVFIASVTLYGKVYTHLNRDVFYVVEGEFKELIKLHGDKRKKRVLKIYVNKEIQTFSALLRVEEEAYMRKFHGQIKIKYQKSPYGTIWIKRIDMGKKVFLRD
jgi:hypothetical protein